MKIEDKRTTEMFDGEFKVGDIVEYVTLNGNSDNKYLICQCGSDYTLVLLGEKCRMMDCLRYLNLAQMKKDNPRLRKVNAKLVIE